MWKWLALVIVVVIAALVWHLQQPVVYQLHITNNSGHQIDRVSLLDSAVVAEVSIEKLPAGQSAALQVSLKSTGVLRFQVEQGLNRLDSILENDVGQLKHKQQFLVIHPDNRLIVTASKPTD